MTADLALVAGVREELLARAEPERAASQQRYMKSALPYYGVALPELRRLWRRLFGQAQIADRSTWEDTVLALWEGATHREERYAAIGLARHRLARDWQDVDALDLYRHLVVTGAWWDLVDEIAAHLVGGVLAQRRPTATPVLAAWAHDPDPWVRRTAILSQLRHRDATDRALLAEAIEASVDDRSFWLRKAIGWALRAFGDTDPEWVRSEVARLGPRLSGLSRREALKHLGAVAEEGS